MHFQQAFSQGDKALIEKFFSGYEKKMSLINMKKEECHPRKAASEEFKMEGENLQAFLESEEAKVIPAHKLLTSFVILSEESVETKAELLYGAYKDPMQDYITNQKLKELVEHLFFLILHALPGLLEYSPPKQKEHLQNMQKRAISDKANLHKFLSGGGCNFRTRDQFFRAICSKSTLFSSMGLRSRVQSIVKENTAHVISKKQLREMA